jgi:cytidylate kinase
MPAHFDDVLLDLKARDDRDMRRSAAPLEQALDADVLDTSDLTVEESIARAIKLVEARLAAAAGEAQTQDFRE